MSLSDFLSEMADERRGATRTSLPHVDAQIMELQALYARYAAGCPFSAGDLVTPRGNTNVTGAGLPHIVLEVGNAPLATQEDAGSCTFGARFDMRVSCFSGQSGTTSQFWVESFDFEPFSQN